jgi:hypothetical protein
MLKIRGNSGMLMVGEDAWRTPTLCPAKLAKDIVKRMIGAAALARCFSFANPVNSERTIIWQRSGIPL